MSFSFPIDLPIMKNNYGQMVVLLMRRVGGWGGVGRGPICQGLMKRNTGAIVESLYKTELQRSEAETETQGVDQQRSTHLNFANKKLYI